MPTDTESSIPGLDRLLAYVRELNPHIDLLALWGDFEAGGGRLRPSPARLAGTIREEDAVVTSVLLLAPDMPPEQREQYVLDANELLALVLAPDGGTTEGYRVLDDDGSPEPCTVSLRPLGPLLRVCFGAQECAFFTENLRRCLQEQIDSVSPAGQQPAPA